ncbi:MAG: ABC transporter permease [Propionibacteriaceae bacterium]|nr:ABC transporter permease [Propionibacteriaceae bacterium]
MRFRLLRASLVRRRSRVLVELLAVAIGASTMFCLATLALDVPSQLEQELRGLGANLLVSPESELDSALLQETQALIPADALVAQAAFRYETIRINSQPYLAVGTDISSATTIKGFWDMDGEWPSRLGEALVGRDVADWIGLRVGQRIILEGADLDHQLPVTVSGIFAAGGNEDALVVLNEADLASLTGRSDVFDVAEYSIALGGDQLSALADHINANVPGVVASPVQRMASSEAQVLAMLRSLLVLVSVIVLTLTVIGISTTMMAVVTERRVEIALRMALGASNKAIQREFILEAVVLGVLGGTLGVVLGFALANLVSQQVFTQSARFNGWFGLVCVVAAMVLAWGASRHPVSRAAAIDPALVLREE